MRGITHRGDTAGDDTALDAVERTEPVRVAHAEPFPPIIESMVSRAGRPLGWLWDHGFRFILVLDAIALFGSMALINLLRFGTDWPTYPTSYYWIGFSLATLIHLLVGYFAGLYEREARLGYRPWLPRIVTATAISVAFDGLATLLTGRYLMPRFNLALLLVVASLVLTFNRTISRNLANRRRGPSRVLLVGNEQAVSTARRHFAESERAAVVVATASQTTGLFNVVNTEDVTDILLLDLSAFTEAFPEPLTALDRQGIGVHQRVSAKETLLGLQSVRQIAGMPFTKMRTHAMASHQLRLKRYFDLTLLIVTSPIWLVALGALALYVRIRVGSPVLYRQTRVGRGGQLFTVLKYRTMVRNAERAGPQISTKEDGRVIRGMAWMRSSRADELPQLLNILKGEMSLVGPRPERPEMIAEIERSVAGYSRRHELPPGLTGFAQVQGRYDTDADYKLGYDLQYLVNWSLMLDVQILVRTVWVVLSRRV